MKSPAQSRSAIVSAMRSWVRSFKPWLAWLSLLILFELPGLLLSEPMRPTADVLALVAAYLLSLRVRSRVGTALRWLLASYGLLLVFYRIDRSGFIAFMGQEPLLYDQLFMVRHLLVLLSDLWSWQVGAGLVASLVVGAGLLYLVRWLLRALGDLPQRPRQYRIALAIVALALVGASFAHASSLEWTYMPRWISPALAANLAKSQSIYASVRRQVRTTPYRDFERLKLQRKPDIYLMWVESYGRVIVDRPSMRWRWKDSIRKMDEKLSAAGWHAASAFSVAPVAGGRSWLAEGSLMMGIHIDYEAVFHHLIGVAEGVPNLVSLLDKQGYNTILLGPADRPRKGVESANYYGYDRQIGLNDLNYTGPKVGWGIVPDQYSLQHTHEHVLRSAPRPLFFNYHMVSSHAPWEDVPVIVNDWRTLNQAPGKRNEDRGNSALGMRVRRFAYAPPRFMNMGELRSRSGRNFQSTILYDLKLLEGYLENLGGDALVFVIGDHQPPFIAAETAGFESVVHVLARDPALLQEFAEQGFKPGLMLGVEDSAAVEHEGMFSLIVRALARCCSDTRPLPAYLPAGTHY
jgi:hypothetical protein